LQRPSSLQIYEREGAKTGVLNCETKRSKKRRRWGDLEPVLITIYWIAKWVNILQDNLNCNHYNVFILEQKKKFGELHPRILTF
jgi:hypothetical protein